MENPPIIVIIVWGYVAMLFIFCAALLCHLCFRSLGRAGREGRLKSAPAHSQHFPGPYYNVFYLMGGLINNVNIILAPTAGGGPPALSR